MQKESYINSKNASFCKCDPDPVTPVRFVQLRKNSIVNTAIHMQIIKIMVMLEMLLNLDMNAC